MWVDNQPEWEELFLDSFSTFYFLQQNTIGNHLPFTDRNYFFEIVIWVY